MNASDLADTRRCESEGKLHLAESVWNAHGASAEVAWRVLLVQGKGYRITLLTIDEAEAEDDDDEYERDRSEWRPSLR